MSAKKEATARVQAKTQVLLLVLDFEVFSKTAMKITIIKKQEIANIFMYSSLFYNINQDSIRDLAAEIYELKLGLNEVVYTVGSKHDALYFVKSGLIELSEDQVRLVCLTAG